MKTVQISVRMLLWTDSLCGAAEIVLCTYRILFYMYIAELYIRQLIMKLYLVCMSVGRSVLKFIIIMTSHSHY